MNSQISFNSPSGLPGRKSYPSVSVIVPTKNRSDDLVETVESILLQNVLPAELIIIDQSASDDGMRRVKTLLMEAAEPIRENMKLHYVLDTAIGGSAIARNLGIEIATKEVLALLDDDVILEPDFFREMLAVYLTDPSVGGVSATVTNYTRPPFYQRLYTSVFQRGPFYDERQVIYYNADRLRYSAPIQVRKFGAGGMSIRRASMGAIRFDPNLRGVPGGEDVEFCCRLPKNTNLVIAPSARYVHKMSQANRADTHWLQKQVRAAYYVYLRHWRSGAKNRLCFAWLNIGFLAVTLIGVVLSGSLRPWRAFREGVRIGTEDARKLSGV
jgi:GT2 family glycosyltransferase